LQIGGSPGTVTPGDEALAVAIRKSKALIDRLQHLLAASGMSARALSKRAKVGDEFLGETYVSDVLAGKNLNPSIPALQAIAKVLGVSLAYLTGENDHLSGEIAPRAVNLIPRLGIIETGAFRKLPDGSAAMVHQPLSQSYPAAKHFVLAMGDHSMDVGGKEGPILPGMNVLCVDMVDAELTVESGKVYAIRRTLDGGATYETIIRRAMVFRDRTELSAESSQPGYEKIVIEGPLSVDPHREIFAFGLVYEVSRSFE
jgi:transcriptional regulator with XRE-family HTH domain